MGDTYFDCPGGLIDPDFLAIALFVAGTVFQPTGVTGFGGEICLAAHPGRQNDNDGYIPL